MARSQLGSCGTFGDPFVEVTADIYVLLGTPPYTVSLES